MTPPLTCPNCDQPAPFAWLADDAYRCTLCNAIATAADITAAQEQQEPPPCR